MKILILDKAAVITAAIAVAITLLLVPISMATGDRAVNAGYEELPIYSVETEEKKVAVTFNAAWGAEDIDQILETLDSVSCRSTFFLVGEWAEKFPEAAKKIQAAGHEIGNHSYDHAHYADLSRDAMRADIHKSDTIIKEVTGETPALFRAPYGEYTASLVRLCRETGRFCIQWDVDSLDWKGLSAAEMAARILPRLRNGSILLFHTGTEQTADALPALLQKIKEQGYEFTTVGDMIYKDGFSVNHEGRQIKQTAVGGL